MKVVIPSAGKGTRFLPLTSVIPKELLPLGDKCLIDYSIEEIGFDNEIILVLSKKKRSIFDYCQKNYLAIKKNFKRVYQRNPNGDGDAVLQAQGKIGNEPFAVMFPDDIFKDGEVIQDMADKYNGNAIIGLKRLDRSRLFSYGVADVKKGDNGLFEIKDIVEKPAGGTEPSDYAIVGRYIFSPDIFHYLRKTKPNKKKEVILAEALRLMIKDGKKVYGMEIKDEWFECGKLVDWVNSWRTYLKK